METLQNPLPVIVLGRRQAGIGDAHLAETELLAPMLDIGSKGGPVVCRLEMYCGFTHDNY